MPRCVRRSGEPGAGARRLLDRVTAHGHVALAADVGEALDVVAAVRPADALLRPAVCVLLLG